MLAPFRLLSVTPRTALSARHLLCAQNYQLFNRRLFSTSFRRLSEKKDSNLSDHEWEMQTGRAIYILTQNLPHFFDLGLIDGVDMAHRPKTRGLLSLTPLASHDHEAEGALYAPNIRLEYSPPSVLPVLPRTFWVEGLPMYIASSVFVRHTLKALHTSLAVELQRVRVNGGSSLSTSQKSREKNLSVAMKVTGIARVTGANSQWDVKCTYHFNQATGLIDRHTVDSIEPTPSESFFEALRALGLGLHGTTVPGGPAARACPIPVEREKRRQNGPT